MRELRLEVGQDIELEPMAGQAYFGFTGVAAPRQSAVGLQASVAIKAKRDRQAIVRGRAYADISFQAAPRGGPPFFAKPSCGRLMPDSDSISS